MSNDLRIGYVLKVFPRLSQTFILRELLAHQQAGSRVTVFSLRPPRDAIVHDRVAELRLPVVRPDDSSAAALVSRWSALEGDPVALARWFKRHAELPEATLGASLALACEVREREIDVLHAHFAKLPATVARVAADLAGVPFCFTAHARDIFHESVDEDDLRTKLAEAAVVVTVSEFNRRHLLELEPRATVHTIYNGLELSRFPFEPPLTRNGELLAVGRLVEKKGFSDLLHACGLLRDRPLICRLIGAGPLGEELATLRRTLALERQVILAGEGPQAAVRQAMGRASLLAAPCIVGADGDRDGLPTVLVEAMALGTPCISTPVTGIPEIVRDDETGLIVPQRAPHRLAEACARLLDDPSLGARLARAARERVERDFDVTRNAARLRELLTDAVSARCTAG